MTPNDWERAKELFEAALELDSSLRASFLAENCREASLLQEVEKLLVNYQAAGSFLDSPAMSSGIPESIGPAEIQMQEGARADLPSGQDPPTAKRAEVEDPMVGRRLGAYKLVRRVGEGGMAAVFQAVRADDEYQKKVAVKLVLPGLDSQDVLNRFRNERQTLASLEHPNIVRLLDGGSAPEGLPFLVMEYVEGSPIDEYCDRHKLTVDERLHLFGEVCDAVQFAHEKLVIHRDLKPTNILVMADGTPKLLDFGIAKVLNPERSTQGWLTTQTGLRCMTPAYASPEQTQGKSVSSQTDVYSLGVVLYELLTGHRPYRLAQNSPAEIERAICEQEPETPSTAINRVETDTSPDGKTITKTPEMVSLTREGQPEKLRRRLRGDLDNIVLKALQKEPEHRYGSVAEFSQDIDRHLQHLPVKARRSTLIYRASRFIERHKTEAYVTSVLVLVLVAAVWLTLPVLSLRSRITGSASTTRLARHAQDSSEWVQLTNFVDSATSPALSRDGRTLVFLRGPSTFASQAEVYVQMLSGGGPIALTHDGIPKMSPVFSPDGSQIAYTVPGAWDTWILPTLGGEPRKFLPNASGLTWISGRQMLFSELREGRHMVLATSEKNRNGERMVFAPPGKGSMVHRSFLSPDGKWVIAVWMSTEGGWNGWESCRLVPFDGNTAGKPVGPADAACTNAAWSPDGQWMYFSADVSGKFHTWRQRFPDGPVEQVTSGVNEEEGIAITPDGRSLVTSVGTYETSIWVHDGKGDHQITSQGHAYLNPEASGRTIFSADGSRVYYLVDRRPQGRANELWFAEISTGKNQAVVAVEQLGFDLSPDGGSVVYSVRASEGKHALWTARVDHLVPPKQLTLTGNNFSPVFTPQGDVVFTSREGEEMFLYRMKADGSDSRKVSDQPVIQLQTVSPDGRWAVAQAEVKNEDVPRGVFAIPLDGGSTIRLCSGLCSVRWPHDGKSVFISVIGGSQGYTISWATYVVPIPPGQLFPKLPPMGIASKADVEALPGAKYMDNFGLPGETGEIFAFNRASVHRNLFKIPLQ